MSAGIEITFLGTGTSVGVPVIGCDCGVCRSDDPRNQRLRASLHVATAETSLIVDTGPDLRQQCLREGIRQLDAAVITHAHSDHLMGFDDLRRFTVGVEDSLEVWATRSCMERLEAAFFYAFNGENKYPGYLKPESRIIEGDFQIGDLTLTPLPVVHGKVETVGFAFSRGGRRKFAYIPDMKELARETESQLQGIELLIVDGLHYSYHPTHQSIDEALALADRLGAQKVWLTHLSCQVDYATVQAKLPAHVDLAWDGLRLRLD